MIALLRAVLVVALLAITACAGRHAPPPKPKELCEMALAPGAYNRPMRPLDWVRLMLHADQRGNALYAETLCTGERIQHDPLPRDCEVQTADPGVPQPIAIDEASVAERILPDNKRLVWIMTHRFPNGDGFGPVAAVEITREAVYVSALGLLRLRPTRVDLNLWEIGQKTVLVGAGESCQDPRKASTCRRAANLLVLDKKRFYAPPIRNSDTNTCIDAPWVEYKREADLTLENGWNRHMRIIATLDHDQRYVVITEQVAVNDTDIAHPDVPPRDVRQIDAERFIHVEGARFYTRQSPLWPKIIPTEGMTQLLSPQP